MNRHKIQINRHKKKEDFKSGSAKQKIAKDKAIKNEEVLAKSRRMTDFIKKCKPTSDAIPEDNTVLDSSLDEDKRARPMEYSSTALLISSASSSQSENFEDHEASSKTPTSAVEYPNPELALDRTIILENDIGKWPEYMTPSDIDYCIKMGA